MSAIQELNLREAVSGDEQFVLRLEELAFRDAIVRAGGWYIPRPGMGDGFPGNCRIIRSGDIDAGCLTLDVKDGCVHLDQFYILPAFQGKGLGRGVLSYVQSEAAVNSQSVRTTVWASAETLRFFTNHGFSVEEQTQRSVTLVWPSSDERPSTSGNTDV